MLIQLIEEEEEEEEEDEGEIIFFYFLEKFFEFPSTSFFVSL